MNHIEKHASIIATFALGGARRADSRLVPSYLQWEEGRSSAVASLFPTVENVAAYNEVKFLANDYWPRHRGTI